MTEALDGRTRLDTRGLYCPVPILRTRNRLREVPPGALIEILADDPVILRDMPAFCRSHGHEYLGHVEGHRGELHLTVRKSRDAHGR